MALRKLIPFSRLKAWYEDSPAWVKSVYATIPFSVRMGPVFRETTRRIEATDFASRDELERMQSDLLAGMVEHAYEHVPFYRHYMDQAGLRPRDVVAPDDLVKLPVVSKQDMQTRIDDFAAVGGLGERAYWDNTGGSTGTPFRFLAPNSTYPTEMAYILAQWKRVGYTPRHRRLTLRGRVFRDGKERWRYNPIYNELQASSYHLDADSLARLLPEVKRFAPTFLYGYPSAVTLFLRTMVDAGLTMPCPIEGVLCGSEPLFEYQRRFIEDTLGCRVYSWYGHSERAVLAGECERSASYHCFPLYGIVELLDAEDRPITTPGVEGEIVATSLQNLAMPFLRYRTGDRGVFDTFDTCACGRSHRRLKNIAGRSQDFVHTRGGRAVPVTAIVFGQHFQAFAHISGMQLFQDTPGEVTVRIVRGHAYADADEKEIREKMEGAVDGDIRIAFEYPQQLPVVESGKTPFVIQKIRSETHLS